MTKPILSIQHIGKRYQLGGSRASQTLRDELTRVFTQAGRRAAAQYREFWALRDVFFDVMPGEAVAIIGRNGAGKSTLLKILSQITPPTEGQIFVRGRTASLLEVGTGFHPELTGRENIFLNGAILGMTRREIAAHFDEIVAFAEIERFLDTPVKRYSSGMYVRLAFAVAAHLEPEILIIDEVLAVGDAMFQQKCLSKMEEVSHGGRTVLFVSHNMTAVQSLCTRGVLLNGGRVHMVGDTNAVIEEYVQGFFMRGADDTVHNRQDRSGTGKVRMVGIRLLDAQDREAPSIGSGEPCTLEFSYEAASPLQNISVAWNLRDERAQFLMRISMQDSGKDYGNFPPHGTLRCAIPRLPLVPGHYRLSSEIQVGGEVADAVEGAFVLTVEGGDFYGTGRVNRHSPVLLDHDWQLDER